MPITLILHTHFFNISNIYILSSTGKRLETISIHFVRLLLQLGAAQHWQFDIQRWANAIVRSVARLKLDGVSGCGVTRYREELRIFGLILFASPTSPKIPILFDAERSRDLSASKREALLTASVSPLAWHVVFEETQSRGTNILHNTKRVSTM